MKRLYLEQQPIPIDVLTEQHGVNTRAKLEEIRPNWPQRYEVRKVVGSTTPKIRSHLTEEQVQTYCADESWQVEITAP